MAWISVQQRLPDPFTKVWLMTDSGRKATGYVKSSGEWFIFCREVAATKPNVIRWEEP